jgi:hypothetical protein
MAIYIFQLSTILVFIFWISFCSLFFYKKGLVFKVFFHNILDFKLI